MNIFRKSGGVASGSEAKETLFEANYLVLTIMAGDVCDVYFSCTIFRSFYMFYTERTTAAKHSAQQKNIRLTRTSIQSEQRAGQPRCFSVASEVDTVRGQN